MALFSEKIQMDFVEQATKLNMDSVRIFKEGVKTLAGQLFHTLKERDSLREELVQFQREKAKLEDQLKSQAEEIRDLRYLIDGHLQRGTSRDTSQAEPHGDVEIIVSFDNEDSIDKASLPNFSRDSSPTTVFVFDDCKKPSLEDLTTDKETMSSKFSFESNSSSVSTSDRVKDTTCSRSFPDPSNASSRDKNASLFLGNFGDFKSFARSCLPGSSSEAMPFDITDPTTTEPDKDDGDLPSTSCQDDKSQDVIKSSDLAKYSRGLGQCIKVEEISDSEYNVKKETHIESTDEAPGAAYKANQMQSSQRSRPLSMAFFSSMNTKTPNISSSQKRRNYSCDVCGKVLSSRSNLNAHRHLHTGQRPFHCKECGACFARLYALQLHLRTHTGEKPYSCQCGKRFARISNYKRHKMTHAETKAKPEGELLTVR